MAITIHDVARAAGVGIGTVSRVINNHAHVKPKTREKVLRAIAQLEYRPNPIARSMISKRTYSIGVIVPFFTRFFFVEVLGVWRQHMGQPGVYKLMELIEDPLQPAKLIRLGTTLIERHTTGLAPLRV